MADIADLAARNDFVNEVLKKHQATQKSEVKRGWCLYCGAKVGDSEIYCDSECKQGHEDELKVRARIRR